MVLQFWEENDDELLESWSDDGIELWEGGVVRDLGRSKYGC